ncbi:hypothetical protein VPH35_022161 [Triticum aestivum]
MPSMGMASTSLLAPTSFAPAAVAATARRHGSPQLLQPPRPTFQSPRGPPPPPPHVLARRLRLGFPAAAYNDAFAHFGVRCPPAADADAPLFWDEAFYDDLQNRIGGGKPKMRWYFGENGWPSSKILETAPSSDEDKEKLVDVIQDWKTERYKAIIKSGTVEPRPGVLRLMDEVKGAGIKLAVCSAATKSSVVLCLENLLGLERFNGLDCFLAGDDVKMKKPDPSIYITAAKKLGLESKNCLVVEDSVIGLQAAKGAGMSCIITYTPSTSNQDFKDAIATYPDLSNVRLEDLKLLLQESLVTG